MFDRAEPATEAAKEDDLEFDFHPESAAEPMSGVPGARCIKYMKRQKWSLVGITK